MGFHCSECVFSSFTLHEGTRRYQATCSRGYTLTNPHEHAGAEAHFADSPEELVPTVDPFGAEYLRTSNVCEHFLRPQDRPQAHENRHNHVRNSLFR